MRLRFASTEQTPNLRVLAVGHLDCPACRGALDKVEAWASVSVAPDLIAARRLLDAREKFDATFLLAETPYSLPAGAAESIESADQAGRVVTLAGPWFEGRLRFQGAIGDESVVYWHNLNNWLRQHFDAQPNAHFLEASAGVVLVTSRDRDAAEAVANALGDHCVTVAWRQRGGRRSFLSRVDTGVWIGGQLDGLATDELAEFCREVRSHGGRAIALLDFPRADEIATATAVGAGAVLAKPWSIEALTHAIQLGATSHEPTASLCKVNQPDVSHRAVA